MSQEKRKQYFVETDVQGGIVLRVVFYWLAVVVLIASIACLVALAQGGDVGGDVLMSRLLLSFGPSLIAALVVLPGLVFDAIRYSHRSVGPIVRIQKEVAKLANGHTPKQVQFRKGDHWQELAVEFNKLADEVTRLRAAAANAAAGTPEQLSR
ncbi:MAG: hypothetical protein AAGA92_02065 [Planctomycetota bacterium]